MAIGLPVTKGDLDFAVGKAAQDLASALARVKALNTYLLGKTEAELQALPRLGAAEVAYTSGEVTLMKSGVADLDQLRTIYEGGAALLVAKDFRSFSKHLAGVGI
jgi:hypothetical protein